MSSAEHRQYVWAIAESYDGLSDAEAAQCMAALLDTTPSDPFVRDHMTRMMAEVDAMRRARRTLKTYFREFRKAHR